MGQQQSWVLGYSFLQREVGTELVVIIVGVI